MKSSRKEGSPGSYEDMVVRLKSAYSQHGHDRGTNDVKKLLSELTKSGIIERTISGYVYQPKFAFDDKFKV